jgi:F-type H+-transporting ATPase subunit b
MKFINQRQSQIKENVEAAQKNKAESEKILESQRKMLQEARKEAHEIRDEAITNAKISGEKIVRDAHNQKDIILDEAHKTVDTEVQKAKKRIEKEIGQFVVSLTDKIIGKKLTGKGDLELIDTIIKTEIKQKRESKVD